MGPGTTSLAEVDDPDAGARDHRRWLPDAALAAGLVLLSLLFSRSPDPPGVTIDTATRDVDALALLLALVQAAPLAARRLAPNATFVVTVGAFAAAVALGYPPSPANLCVLVAPYSAAKFARPGRLWPAAAALAVTYALLAAATWVMAPADAGVAEAVFTPLIIAVPWCVGLVQRDRWLRLQRLEEQARALRQEAARRQQAVVEERRRVARELHDIVGHGVTGMIVQAEAARVGAGTPAPLDAALADIAATGRQALGELRLVLDLMRRADWGPVEGEPDAGIEVPGTAQLGVLVEQIRRTGQPVELVTAGDVRPLPPPVDASVYRIVQEALTNVVKHARAAPAQVSLQYRPGEIEVVVSDEGGERPGPVRPGFGLLGMRERVELFGGTLQTGSAGSGFRVRAVLPVPLPAGGTA